MALRAGSNLGSESLNNPQRPYSRADGRSDASNEANWPAASASAMTRPNARASTVSAAAGPVLAANLCDDPSVNTAALFPSSVGVSATSSAETTLMIAMQTA